MTTFLVDVYKEKKKNHETNRKKAGMKKSKDEETDRDVATLARGGQRRTDRNRKRMSDWEEGL